MCALFRNKYHICSIRHHGYDYSSPGMYFITICTASRNHYFGEIVNSFGPQSKNMASIIRGFKSAVTICARKINPGFAWQSKYYDHIIRTHIELIRIRNYIRDNPDKWNKI